MSGEHDHDVEYHLREALQHLAAAQEQGDLRKTNDVAIDQVSNTIASVLNEHNRDER